MPRTIRLLIVDDEPLLRALLGEIFRQRGHEVRTATDGFSALHTMREWTPLVLISDLYMPGMSGFELLSVVRRRMPTVQVVATSGAFTGGAVPEGVAADAYHPKGTGMHNLLDMVESKMGTKKTSNRRLKDHMPIWTERCVDDAAVAREAYAMISCPECLRALPQVVDSHASTFRETECKYCKAPVQYAVVPELNPATAQPFGMARQE